MYYSGFFCYAESSNWHQKPLGPLEFSTGTNSDRADTFTFIFNVKCSIKFLILLCYYIPCKNIWCHFKNYFKLEIKTLIVGSLAIVEVTVLVLLPDYADGHENASCQNHHCYYHHSIPFFVNTCPIIIFLLVFSLIFLGSRLLFLCLYSRLKTTCCICAFSHLIM